MHESSYLKMEAFFQAYADQFGDGERFRVLDVGSASINKGKTYRNVVQKYPADYVGLDMEAGENVDIVVPNPYCYTDVASESFDVVVSGQAFEHNPYFWPTFCEIARVLKQGGYCAIIAPSSGRVHRFPYDCWRYYPDSWVSLCVLAGMTHVETVFEPERNRDLVKGATWRDSMVVAQKPVFADAAEADAFHARLAEFTAPFAGRSFEIPSIEVNKGRAFAMYQRSVARLPREVGSPTEPLA